MRSKFAIAGHPLHPALVALPIGLFVWALIADVVYLASGRDHTWYEISFWSSIAGIVAALIAALPGFGDYVTIASKSDAAGVATLHMLLNLVIIGIFAISVALMFDNNATSGTLLFCVLALHIVGNGLLGIAGWLGGELAFRYHVGMLPDSMDVERAEQQRHTGKPRPIVGGR